VAAEDSGVSAFPGCLQFRVAAEQAICGNAEVGLATMVVQQGFANGMNLDAGGRSGIPKQLLEGCAKLVFWLALDVDSKLLVNRFGELPQGRLRSFWSCLCILSTFSTDVACN